MLGEYKRFRLLVAALGAVAVVLLAAPAAQGAVCADHPNQRSAQQAKDTRDADGDGIYCEALPCPCLKPGQGGSKPKPKKPASKPKAVKRAPVKKKAKPKPPRELYGVTITRTIDGDTVRARLASGGYLTVRLIGIDAPESTALRSGSIECGGAEASAAMEAFRVEHEDVTLVADTTQDRYDSFGRFLAYIEPDDPTLAGTYQQWMLSQGWAEVYVYENWFRRGGQFEASALAGAQARAGVWGLCGGDFHLPL